METNYLEGLNPAQRSAVEHTEGALMVIAGAGSGKTRVLTLKIAYLIQQGIQPYNILSLTFTNKAAKEMQYRIADIVGPKQAKSLWMGTFHSIFSKILRIEHERIGYPSNFSIYDTEDCKSVIKGVLKDLKLDDNIYKPNQIISRISTAKNNLISSLAYAHNKPLVKEDEEAGKPRMAEIYQLYDQRLYKAGAMDFDDLLYKTNILFKDFEDVLVKYQNKFKQIMVDEYQDTNYAQYLIVKKLSAKYQNICVVGDDAQSIYAFRGADISNILNYQNDYPNYKMYKLEQNYRSTQVIVEAANSVIANNKDQIKKNTFTTNEQGEKIRIFRASTDREEGKAVIQDIKEKMFQQNLMNKDFAILYRTNMQSRAFEECLRKSNIPYRIHGGISFYHRKEVKDILSYIRLASNPTDEEALKRVINYPKRGIGKSSIDAIQFSANEHSVTQWDVINHPERYRLKLAPGSRVQIAQFVQLIKSFADQVDQKDAYTLGNKIASETGILKDLHTDKTPEGVGRHENVQELINGLKEFVDRQAEDGAPDRVNDFMSEIALLTDLDENKQSEDNNKVTLMTVHSSKGLEFPHVFIVGMEENLFPSQLSMGTRAQLEEERRLFYVAVTRAETTATLTFATTRYKWGKLTTSEPSRFIEEIKEEFLDRKDGLAITYREAEIDKDTPTKYTPPKVRYKKYSTPSSSSETKEKHEVVKLIPGNDVIHGRFGKGKVLNVDGKLPDQKATIFFPSVGQKQILVKFAKLEVLN